MTRRAHEILKWPRLKKLIVSIDGPRGDAKRDELYRRNDVILTSEALASQHGKLELFVWNDNQGLNVHLKRFMQKLLPLESSILLVEDDISVTDDSLDFLANNIDIDGAKAVAAHVSHSHENIDKTYARRTLFPRQWGLAISGEVIEVYLDVLQNSQIRRKPIQKSILEFYKHRLNRRDMEFLAQWWFNHFYFCLKHGNWADALLQYSVMFVGGHYRVPSQSLIYDDSEHFDERAITPREPFKNNLICNGEQKISNENLFVCRNCELQDSHIDEATLRNILGATKYRRKLILKDAIESRKIL